ncbi:carboxypeptidase M32 [Zavarzinia compransoris]|uniref:Metal-dependent carboxypeptidase n=1 Tax=Zavarzinia compransoris TaxID=1264899 RepID=A0A317E145_9PROT|nr:carboxypeptidase M32 [Zavarzinia compransoris]PWR19846.1 carboxypeptidase M32 [Zavarzinia compransoris]TDP45045.1 carboxypeptidase Taq [Zavarzinia compransoris]
MTANSAYSRLEDRFRRLSAVQGALSVLHWDSAAVMPAGGAEVRGEQIAALSLIAHEQITAPEIADLIEAAATEPLEPWPAANLSEIRRNWRHATAVPADLVEAIARQSHETELTWRSARAANDFASLAPRLQSLLDLVRQVAAAKAEAFGLSPYDALLDEYEAGGRSARIDQLFDELGAFLPDLRARVIERQNALPPALPVEGPFPVEAQRALAERILDVLQFDRAHGRLDVSHHPFTGGVPDDVRITTRYAEADFTRSLMGVIHETGHAQYERGLPKPWRGQPVGNARGMVLHESQSLLFEMQACRTPEFIAFLAPLVRSAFDRRGPAYEAANLQRVYHRVSPGLIRVDADEVCYPSHVILRYRLERAMIAGDLKVADLPGAWNEGMAALLGITPPSDADGCMQDIHWPGGSFGYFPTYTLGAMAAAQLFAAATAADGAILPGIAQGDFKPLLAWLRPHVHEKGSSQTTDEVLIGATGLPLGTAAFKAHLERRYLNG